MNKVIHRRYVDTANRPDLRSLAKCNNINGPICPLNQLTSDDAAVTCKRCLRIMKGIAIPRKAFSDATLRQISRGLGKAPTITLKDALAMLEDARKVALRALGQPHGTIAYQILAALGVSRIEAEDYRRRVYMCRECRSNVGAEHASFCSLRAWARDNKVLASDAQQSEP